jgi:hypothetical protein
MKKPEKTKTDPIGWILAFLFPKKGKPVTPAAQKPLTIPQPAPAVPKPLAAPQAAPSAPKPMVTFNSAPPQPQVDAVKPAVTQAPQVIHSVTSPPAPIKPAVKPAETPPAGQSGLTKASPKPAASRFKFDSTKVMPTVWTVASVLSLIVNIILIVVLLVLGRELFVLKALVGDQLLGGLYKNFIYMDLAHIKTEITVKDSIPINFTLPISQDTVVVLTENTPINGANVRITSGGLSINSAANIVLPRGTSLPVHLELNVPVTTNVPVTLKVPIDIPLDQTELHKPFIGLQQVVDPFYKMLFPQYKKASDVPACQSAPWLCNTLFANP